MYLFLGIFCSIYVLLDQEGSNCTNSVMILHVMVKAEVESLKFWQVYDLQYYRLLRILTSCYPTILPCVHLSLDSYSPCKSNQRLQQRLFNINLQKTPWGRKLLSEVTHCNEAVEAWYIESDYESEEKITEGPYITRMHHMPILMKNRIDLN